MLLYKKLLLMTFGTTYVNSYPYSFHTFIIHICNIHFNIILPSILRFSNNCLTLRFFLPHSQYIYIYIYIYTHTYIYIYIYSSFSCCWYFRIKICIYFYISPRFPLFPFCNNQLIFSIKVCKIIIHKIITAVVVIAQI